MVIGETEQAVEDKFTWIEEHLKPLVPADDFDRTMKLLRDGPLVGTPEQIAEKLTAAQKLGMTYAICYFPDAAYDRESVELFESKVIPVIE